MKIRLISIFFVAVTLCLGCNKDKLDLKPNQSLVVPSSIQDYQAILDNNLTVFNVNQPWLGEVGSDNYYLFYPFWNSLSTVSHNAYIWSTDVYQGNTVADWVNAYKQIYNCNVVLEGINKLSTEPNAEALMNVQGSVLFFRANAYWTLAQEFCAPYDSSSAESDLGLPLRLHSDVLSLTKRSTLKETYQQIIDDLHAAQDLLPATTLYLNRPSKAATYAYLARVYLSMKKINEALSSASNSLKLYNTLLDYNSLNTAAPTPFPKYNPEVLWDASLGGSGIFSTQTNFIIDSTLYASFAANDLRKTLFFTTNTSGLPIFKGSYEQSTTLMFAGLSVDEVLLTRAETYARTGNITAGMKDLNDLLRTRWKKVNGTTTYIDQVAQNQTDALSKILNERRKELIFRGLRWTDIRRLNKEGFNIQLIRSLNGQKFILPPNSQNYVYPIPDQEIQLNPMEQNPRS